MHETLVTLPNLLHNLTIEKMNIQPDTAVMLGKIVQSQLKLTCLTLTQADLDDTAVSAFCDTLGDHKTLEEFDVSKNNLTADGAMSLSSLLPKLTTLKRFDVSHNNIGVDGCNYIIDAINKMRHCSLEILQLSVSQNDSSTLFPLVNKTIKLRNMKY